MSKNSSFLAKFYAANLVAALPRQASAALRLCVNFPLHGYGLVAHFVGPPISAFSFSEFQLLPLRWPGQFQSAGRTREFFTAA
jgi:hypothetical protein